MPNRSKEALSASKNRQINDDIPLNISGDLQSLEEKDQAFLKILATDYHSFRFCLEKKRFSFRQNTIFLGPPQPNFALLTLHELSHGLCGHKDYHTHVERLKIESAAWQRAKTILKNYQKSAASLLQSPQKNIRNSGQALQSVLPSWDQDFVEDSLDTYRDWLHGKSRCRKCGLTCYQDASGQYHCPFCDTFSSK